jgi:DNA helicase II / ATP-dependent DNA helicase PcrA
MKFIADFHIHSKYSRATAANLDLENLYIHAQIKGITVIGTGDFTHPAWWGQIKEKLVPAEQGLFQLRSDIATACDAQVPPGCRQPVRFMLVTEISNIYKKAERTRKNHNLVFMPDMDAAEQFNRRLGAIGNIESDGRPILGLDARNLLEIVLETADGGYLVPAHIWTPWFSLLGSKSGFDTVEACFEDLTPHIFALETGLSSDPPMNWQVSALDRYTLISNSDAHSPSKLGREANCFDTELSYAAIRTAMENGDGDQFLGTYEFYPDQGKYHVDGHRKCDFRSLPKQTRALDGICPVCAKPLTVGVLYRVEALADRDPGAHPPQPVFYRNLIPLDDLLAEVLQVGPKSKTVTRAYHQLIQTHGSEFDILCHIPQEALEKSHIPLLAEAIQRMRKGAVVFNPGFDGEFGRVRIFDPSERALLQGQQRLFDLPDAPPSPTAPLNPGPAPVMVPEKKEPPLLFEPAPPETFQLNADQQAAVDHLRGPLLISAGPGTGKTRTITCRMAALIERSGVAAESILAVTFTNKAAQEMRRRLQQMLAPGAAMPLVGTFHGICRQLLNEVYQESAGQIVDEDGRRALLTDALDQANANGLGATLSIDALTAYIVEAKQQLLAPTDDLSLLVPAELRTPVTELYQRYQALLTFQELVDFEDLIFQVVKLLETDKGYRRQMQRRFTHLFVDEFQDINLAQYRLLRALAPAKANVCVIGDPDQAIYGFRGSDVRYFARFSKDYAGTRTIRLNRNYRSSETILAAAFQVIRKQHTTLGAAERVRTYSGIEGVPTLSIVETPSERSEAVAIGLTIEQMVGGLGLHSVDFDKIDATGTQTECSFSDVGVLCRTGRQAEFIAAQLSGAGIPCQLASRKRLAQGEVATLLAAYRVISGQGTYMDLNLLTGLSPSGINQQSLAPFKQWAYAKQLPLATALFTVNRLPIPGLSTARQKRLLALVRLIETLKHDSAGMTATQTLIHIAERTPLATRLNAEERQRIAALAEPFGRNHQAFAAALALQHDTDLYQPGVEKVAVMTLHAAKGLEFPIVFVAGCEQGLIPFQRPGRQTLDMEEERRLFYVAMTRAKAHLLLTWARKRTLYGQTKTTQLSPFVTHIEKRLTTRLSHQAKHLKPTQEQLSLF